MPKLLCLSKNCDNIFEENLIADAHDRNYCQDCLFDEYRILKKLSNTKLTSHYARPAGKRMRPKTIKKKLYLQNKAH